MPWGLRVLTAFGHSVANRFHSGMLLTRSLSITLVVAFSRLGFLLLHPLCGVCKMGQHLLHAALFCTMRPDCLAGILTRTALRIVWPAPQLLAYQGLRLLFWRIPLAARVMVDFSAICVDFRGTMAESPERCLSTLAANGRVLLRSPQMAADKLLRPVPLAALSVLLDADGPFSGGNSVAAASFLVVDLMDLHVHQLLCRICSASAIVALGIPSLPLSAALACAALAVPSFPAPVRDRSPRRNPDADNAAPLTGRSWPSGADSPSCGMAVDSDSQVPGYNGAASDADINMGTHSADQMLPHPPPWPSAVASGSSASSAAPSTPAPLGPTAPAGVMPSSSLSAPSQAAPAATAGTVHRVCCPVPGCPKASPANGAYVSHQSMRAHLNDHCYDPAGRGAVPRSYLQQHNLRHCSYCHSLISARTRGPCRYCRDAQQATIAANAMRDQLRSTLPAVDTSESPPASAGPMLSDISTRYVPLVRSIPKELHPLWARCLSRAVADAVFNNSLEAFRDLQMLSKCVLCTCPRAGKAHSSQRVAFTRGRLNRWLRGERASLWRDMPQYTPPKAKRTSAEGDKHRRAQRCIDLCGEGGDSAACKALTKDPPLSHSATVHRQLKDKHPLNNRPPSANTLLGPRGPPPTFDGDTVERGIRSFHRLSGGGPSGLKPLHLQQALGPAYRDQVVEHTTALVQLLASGHAPAALAPILAGASLAALPKKDGGIRPIAVGETWRRLVGKCLCKASQEHAATLLFPLQIGVAQPLGTEVGVHTARQWCQRNAGDRNKVFLKIDFENAFNTVDRVTFLQQCRLHFPSLAPWAEWCYTNPSLLLFGNRTVSSESGVQQGDPLGPLLFALALQPILAKIKGDHSGNGLELCFAYLDDCVLAGSSDAVAAAFADIRTAAGNIGLKVSLGRDKSLLIPCASVSQASGSSAFPAELEVQDDGNFDFLGAPIGTAAHCRAHTAQRVSKACKLLQALGELPDPSVALRLLRHCASFGKLVYSTRVVPHTCHATALREFDDATRDCIESFLCASFSSEDWSLASLSTKSGGLGLRHASVHCAGAFLASSQSTETLCRQLDSSYSLQLDQPTSDAALAMADLNDKVLPEDRLDASSEGKSQKEWSRRIDVQTLHSIKTAAALTNPARRAHLELTGAPRAGSWLHARPSPNTGTHMDPLLFKTSILTWLRMPVFDADGICPLCDGVLDRYGDHCAVCPCGGDRTRRHNMLRNHTFHYARSAGLNPELEKPGLLQPRPSLGSTPEDGSRPSNPEARRPADVFLPRWRRGTPTALDFAVTSGMRNVRACIQDALSAVTSYEDFKRGHLGTERLCSDEGFAFCPMVVEAIGGAWGPAAAKVFG